MILGHWSLFHCHVADSNVAPASHVRENKGGGRELADLDTSSPVSVHRCWPSFVSQVVVGFGGCSLSFVGSHLHLWAVVFVFWPVVVTGCLWVVIGIGCCVMVAIGSVVGLCLWLVEERSDEKEVMSEVVTLV